MSKSLYDEIADEQKAEFLREQRTLNDLAFCFLFATNNEIDQAVELFETSIDRLCENNVLQIYRYREVLKFIRAGL